MPRERDLLIGWGEECIGLVDLCFYSSLLINNVSPLLFLFIPIWHFVILLGLWIVLAMLRRQILWQFSIEVRFCTVAVDPSTQDRSSWCGMKRVMPKIMALHFTPSGRESPLQEVKSKHSDFIVNMWCDLENLSHDEIWPFWGFYTIWKPTSYSNLFSLFSLLVHIKSHNYPNSIDQVDF